MVVGDDDHLLLLLVEDGEGAHSRVVGTRNRHALPARAVQNLERPTHTRARPDVVSELARSSNGGLSGGVRAVAPVGGLGDLVDGHQAESLVEGERVETALLEDVGEGLQMAWCCNREAPRPIRELPTARG